MVSSVANANGDPGVVKRPGVLLKKTLRRVAHGGRNFDAVDAGDVFVAKR